MNPYPLIHSEPRHLRIFFIGFSLSLWPLLPPPPFYLYPRKYNKKKKNVPKNNGTLHFTINFVLFSLSYTTNAYLATNWITRGKKQKEKKTSFFLYPAPSRSTYSPTHLLATRRDGSLHYAMIRWRMQMKKRASRNITVWSNHCPINLFELLLRHFVDWHVSKTIWEMSLM